MVQKLQIKHFNMYNCISNIETIAFYSRLFNEWNTNFSMAKNKDRDKHLNISHFIAAQIVH